MYGRSIYVSATTVVHSKVVHVSISNGENGHGEETEAHDEFYNAIAGDSSLSEDEESDDEEVDQKVFQSFLL